MKQINALVFCSAALSAEEVDFDLSNLKIPNVSFRALSEARDQDYRDANGLEVTLEAVDLVIALDNRSWNYLLGAKKGGHHFQPKSAGYTLTVPIVRAPVPAAPEGPDRSDVKRWLWSEKAADALYDSCLAAMDLAQK